MAWITEQQNVDELVVYGYLRGPARPGRRLQVLSATLRDYCDKHELRLDEVFTERADCGSTDGSVFIGLLDALKASRPYGVVLPSRTHLGPRSLASGRAALIAAHGARLIAVR
jgi:hypothetical protein